jgi:hypothetical protein
VAEPPSVGFAQILHRAAGEVDRAARETGGAFGASLAICASFYCARARLCVEIDGYAHATGDRPQRDASRDGYLAAAGVHVERVAAKAVLQDPYAVAAWMRQLAVERVAALS